MQARRRACHRETVQHGEEGAVARAARDPGRDEGPGQRQQHEHREPAGEQREGGDRDRMRAEAVGKPAPEAAGVYRRCAEG